jgi:decaprenyl-phosphate phosphoribosyltransferase
MPSSLIIDKRTKLRVGELVHLLRVNQWAKNCFVLAPLFFSANLLRPEAVFPALAGFVAFCLLSSAVYIFNDWRDIEADRNHVKKRMRPLPSGRVSVSAALTMMVALIAAALSVTYIAALPAAFLAVCAAYVVINLSYSLGLKQVSVLELLLVSSGFVLRLLAGGYVIAAELSPWIITATATIALLLTIGKRRCDIASENDPEMNRRSLKTYNLAYLDAMTSTLTGANLVVYLLFCVSDYATARFGGGVLLTAVPVAAGLMRYLQLVMVYGDGDMPADLVLKDKGLLAILLVFLAMFTGLIYFA